MKTVLFLDTETTGLPAFNKDGSMPHFTNIEAYNKCRLLQIGGVLSFENGEIYQTFSIYIKNGEPFFNDAVHINHITENHIKQYGFDISVVLFQLAQFIEEADEIVIQKTDFDANVIISEFIRDDFSPSEYRMYGLYEKLLKSFCTKKFFTNCFANMMIPMKSIHGASLSEIYSNVVEKELPKNQHNALTDAMMLYEIYFQAKLNERL